jgi:hypothetical protein
MKEEARKYIQAGFSAIPLGVIRIVNGEKKITYPSSGWKQYQTRFMTEEEINRAIFTNIGIVTGELSNIIVLDADKYKSTFDHELLKSLNLPITANQTTGRGGTQFFFRRDGVNVRNSVCIGHPDSGIDIRADGGMVIVAPSKTTAGGEYIWQLSPLDTPLAPLPEALKSFLTQEKTRKQSKPLSSLVNLVEGQGRDNAMTSLVGKLCSTINPELWLKEIPPVMSAVNQTYNPPLSNTDLNRIYNSITNIDAKRRKEFKEIIVPNKKEEVIINLDSAMSFKEFITKEYPPAKFAIEPFFELETLNMLSAPPNNWKSWLLFYLGVQIARGDMAFGKFRSEKLGVLIVNEEDSARAIQDRFKSLGVTQQDLQIYLHVAKGLKINKSFIEQIVKEMNEKNLKILILDSLRALHSMDENSSKEMQEIADYLKEITRRGITVIFTHHHRKKTFGDKGDQAESTRGSSALNAAASGHVSLEEQVRDTGTYLVVRHLKSKAVEKLPPFELKVIKNDGKISFENCGSFQDSKKKVIEAKDSILNILSNSSYETINSFTKMGVASNSVVREAIKELSQESFIASIKRSEAESKGIKLKSEGKPNQNLYYLIEHKQIGSNTELEMWASPYKDDIDPNTVPI